MRMATANPATGGLQRGCILAQRSCATNESCRAPGTLGEAQKQPGGLPPHSATRVQHSPPLCVLQQQSTSATFHVSMIDASAAASGTRHRALSECLGQLASAFADEKVAKINANAITIILPLERFSLFAPYHPCWPGTMWREPGKNWAGRGKAVPALHPQLGTTATDETNVRRWPRQIFDTPFSSHRSAKSDHRGAAHYRWPACPRPQARFWLTLHVRRSLKKVQCERTELRDFLTAN